MRISDNCSEMIYIVFTFPLPTRLCPLRSHLALICVALSPVLALVPSICGQKFSVINCMNKIQFHGKSQWNFSVTGKSQRNSVISVATVFALARYPTYTRGCTRAKATPKPKWRRCSVCSVNSVVLEAFQLGHEMPVRQGSPASRPPYATNLCTVCSCSYLNLYLMVFMHGACYLVTCSLLIKVCWLVATSISIAIVGQVIPEMW